MADELIYFESHREVAEALVKHKGLHEGKWTIVFQFGLGAANVQSAVDAPFLPAAIVPILKVGLQRSNTENNLTVDAARVNPKRDRRTTKKTAGKKSGAKRIKARTTNLTLD